MLVGAGLLSRRPGCRPGRSRVSGLEWKMSQLKLNRGASIVGVGCTEFGNMLETPGIKGLCTEELAVKAAFEALDDAGLEPKDIDAFFIGGVQMSTAHMFAHYSRMCDWLGLQRKPGLHFETACSTTNTGAGLAAMAIGSGRWDNILVVGVDSILSHPVDNPPERVPMDAGELWTTTDYGADQEYAVPHGWDIAPGYGAFPTLAYAQRYGLTLAQMDEIMFHMHMTIRRQAVLEPKGFVKQDLPTLAASAGIPDPWEFWNSQYNPYAAWPTRALSCLNPCDGASAYVVTPADKAKSYTDVPIDILGFDWATFNGLADKDPLNWDVDRLPFEGAYKMAGITPADIDYLSVHDCMQIYQLVLGELSGYLEKGQGYKAFLDERTGSNGDKPICTHGGKHGKGHAFGASGGSDIYEAVKQMKGAAGPRQIAKEPAISVVHNAGYCMHTAVTVLGRRD